MLEKQGKIKRCIWDGNTCMQVRTRDYLKYSYQTQIRELSVHGLTKLNFSVSWGPRTRCGQRHQRQQQHNSRHHVHKLQCIGQPVCNKREYCRVLCRHTQELIPCNSVLIDKLMVAQLFKKWLWNRSFITVFTKTRHSVVSWATWIQSSPHSLCSPAGDPG
jgi:hypothetical protein